MRVGGSLDLTGPDVYRLTMREIELFVEGQGEKQDRMMEMVAWATMHLMNVHLGKGKKIKSLQDLLTKDHRQRIAARMGGRSQEKITFNNAAELKSRMKAAGLAKSEAAWWKSGEGRRVLKFLREQDPEQYPVPEDDEDA